MNTWPVERCEDGVCRDWTEQESVLIYEITVFWVSALIYISDILSILILVGQYCRGRVHSYFHTSRVTYRPEYRVVFGYTVQSSSLLGSNCIG